MTRPSSIEAAPDVEWPPPRTVKGMLCSRIRARVAETSDVEVTRTTAAWGVVRCWWRGEFMIYEIDGSYGINSILAVYMK
jgi:hypothetical protein